VGIKHLHRKYELKEAISYLDEPESKTKWTVHVTLDFGLFLSNGTPG
jgi:hypothetical protein